MFHVQTYRMRSSLSEQTQTHNSCPICVVRFANKPTVRPDTISYHLSAQRTELRLSTFKYVLSANAWCTEYNAQRVRGIPPHRSPTQTNSSELSEIRISLQI